VRVLYFSRDYSPHDHRFLSAILSGGHEAHYLRLERNTLPTEGRPLPAGVQVVEWEGARSPWSWGQVSRLTAGLRQVLAQVRPDLVHAGPIQSCALLVALAGFRPLLTMSWGFDLMQDAHRGVLWLLATRYTLMRSTFFTSDARVTRDRAVAFGMDRRCTSVVPWGVDLSVFRPRAWPSKRPTTFTLFCNRAWEPRYGVDVLARAFVEVAGRRSDIRLILLAGGSQAPALQRILSSGGALDRVEFGGQVQQPDLPRWYHMADLYISPSHVDGASVSLMEAMACGLPALVSDIPGNREWVQEQENGWLFPDGDHAALAARIMDAAERWPQLSEMGKAGRRVAEARADWQVNSQNLMETYQKAWKGR